MSLTRVPDNYYKKKSRHDRIDQPAHYLKFETEFFDTVKECAELIDKLIGADERLKYSRMLNRVFVRRSKLDLMILYRQLITLAMKGR